MNTKKAVSLIDNYFEVLKSEYYPEDKLKQFPVWRKGSIYKLRGVFIPGQGLDPEVLLQRMPGKDDDLDFIPLSKFTSLFGLRYPDEVTFH